MNRALDFSIEDAKKNIKGWTYEIQVLKDRIERDTQLIEDYQLCIKDTEDFLRMLEDIKNHKHTATIELKISGEEIQKALKNCEELRNKYK